MAEPDMPVQLVPHDPAWARRFEVERARLEPLLSQWLDGRIEHVGSTAVPGLAAKPIVDMMAPVRDHEESRAAVGVLERKGWTRWAADPYAAWRHWFLKPSVAHRTHHLYLITRAEPEFSAVLAWRDHLRARPEEAAAYEARKRDLAARFPDDRAAYASGKSEFLGAAFRRMGRTLPHPREYRSDR